MVLEITIDYSRNEDSDDAEIHFLGVLANVGSDILKLRLDRGFQIVAMKKEEGIDLWAELEGVPKESNFFRLEKIQLSKDGNLYLITNRFAGWVTTCGENNEGAVLDDEYDDAARVPLYLHPKLQLLRLFTAKNLFLPFEYYYIVENGKLSLRRKSSNFGTIDFHRTFSLSDQDIPKLTEFLRETVFPFRLPFLGLAFLHFEASFQTRRPEQAFLSLITSLEILFQPSSRDKGFFIGKNCASLLRDEMEDGEHLAEEVREFYRERNLLVHEGIFSFKHEGVRKRLGNENDLSRLRDIVSHSIRKVYSLGLDKKELLEWFPS